MKFDEHFVKERKYIKYPFRVLFLPSFELVNCKRRSKSALRISG